MRKRHVFCAYRKCLDRLHLTTVLTPVTAGVVRVDYRERVEWRHQMRRFDRSKRSDTITLAGIWHRLNRHRMPAAVRARCYCHVSA